MGRAGQGVDRELPAGGVTATAIPPLARRPLISPAMALREEINDSWRLLVGSLGAAFLVAVALFTLATALG
jgi:hypothetical protein